MCLLLPVSSVYGQAIVPVVTVSPNDDNWRSVGLDILDMAAYQDRLYCATNSDGLLVYELTTGNAHYIDEQEGLPKLRFESIAIDQTGDIWLAAGNEGLYRYHNGEWIVYDAEDGLLDKYVYSLAVDHDNNIWIGYFYIISGIGLQYYNGSEFITINLEDLNAEVQDKFYYFNPCAITLDYDNVVWFGAFSGAVLSYDGTSWKYYEDGSGPGHISEIRDIYIDPFNNKWICGHGGVAKYDNHEWTIYCTSGYIAVSRYEFLIYDTTESFINNNVYCCSYNNGSYYFGNYFGGLTIYSPPNWDNIHISDNLRIDHINSLITVDGTVYIGTYYGLYRYEEISTDVASAEVNDNKLFIAPNPGNNVVSISYYLDEPTEITLDIYNIMGQRIETLCDQYMPPGYHTVTWSGEKTAMASSGQYFAVLKQGGRISDTQKFLLLKNLLFLHITIDLSAAAYSVTACERHGNRCSCTRATDCGCYGSPNGRILRCRPSCHHGKPGTSLYQAPRDSLRLRLCSCHTSRCTIPTRYHSC